MRHRLQDATPPEARFVCQLHRFEDGAEGDADRAQLRHRLMLRALARPTGDDLVALGLAPQASPSIPVRERMLPFWRRGAGRGLLRALMAWQRGEPRVCAMTAKPKRRGISSAVSSGTSLVAVRIGDSFDSEVSQDVHSAGTTGTVNRTTRTA